MTGYVPSSVLTRWQAWNNAFYAWQVHIVQERKCYTNLLACHVAEGGGHLE